MTLEMQRTRPASELAIRAVTARYGPLPQSFLHFISLYDGVNPPANRFQGPECAFEVRAFIPAADIGHEAKSIDGMPSDLIPVAYDSCGNYFCMGCHDHAIYFWDHEIEDGVTRIADSFDVFLEGMEPYIDDGSDEPEIISVWVHPDLKPKPN